MDKTAADFSSIVVLTGAGISAESGLKTFRDNNGLWEGHAVDEVATPEAFATNPALVQRFYNLRRAQLNDVKPNTAHQQLADFAKTFDGDFLLVTQNVDDLHERGGSTDVLHMHGELTKVKCTASGQSFRWREEIRPESLCPCCNLTNTLRPDIVWFGEIPYQMERIEQALVNCDLFVAIGTSGVVYPAAGFVDLAKSCGATCVEINLAHSANALRFDKTVLGSATAGVNQFFSGHAARQKFQKQSQQMRPI